MTSTIASALAIYFVVWWITLFVTLPFGVRSQSEENATSRGTDPGAPVRSRMAAKLVWTTFISALLFAVGWLAYRAGLLNIERLAQLLGFPF